MAALSWALSACRGVAARFDEYLPPVRKAEWYIPVGASVLYLATVFATKAWARGRAAAGAKPLDLRAALIAHNLALCVGSAALFLMMAASLATRWARVDGMHGEGARARARRKQPTADRGWLLARAPNSWRE